MGSQIRHSTTHPHYLHSNSTSHSWVFGAIAEIVDNSADSKATQFFIDMEERDPNDLNPNGDAIMYIRDNGVGMDPEGLHKMLSFGHSSKVQTAIGRYGNGFKSGSMRIGRDAVVFTFDGTYRSIGMLSQTFLEDIDATEVLVPLATWKGNGEPYYPEHVENIEKIIKYSPFNSFSKIMDKFADLDQHGTLIAVYNLRRTNDGRLELDYTSNVTDIKLTSLAQQAEEDNAKKKKQALQVESPPPEDNSLRAYLSILYLEPRMQMFVRGHRVFARRLKTVLWKKRDYSYTPRGSGNEKVNITFGFNTRNKHRIFRVKVIL